MSNLQNHSTYRVSLNNLNQREVRQDIAQKGGAVITRNGEGPIGVALTTTLAPPILGQKIWNTRNYGTPVSQLTQKISGIALGSTKLWRTITVNGQAPFTFLSLALVRELWSSLQIHLPSVLALKLAQELNTAVWPYIELHAKNCKLIVSDWRHPLPYIQIDDIINQENPDTLSGEIKRYNKPIILSRDLTGVKAFLLPLSMKQTFEEHGIQIENTGVRRLRFKEYNLQPDKIYLVGTHTGGQDHNPTPLFLLAHPEPSNIIQGIIENAHCFTPLEEIEAVTNLHTPREVWIDSRLSPEAALKIAEQFHKASNTCGVSSLVLKTESRAECFIGMIADPRIVGLMNTIPMEPVQPNVGRENHRLQLKSKLFGLLRGDNKSSILPAALWTKEDKTTVEKNLRAFFHQTTYSKTKNCVTVLSTNGSDSLGMITGSRELFQTALTLQYMLHQNIDHN